MMPMGPAAAGGIADGGFEMPQGMEKEEALVLANMRHNYGVVAYLQAFVCVVGGLATGVLGGTGWWGVVGFLLTQAAFVLAVVGKAGGDVHSTLNLKAQDLARFGLLDQAAPFIFFWTFAYTLVHVY
jgi:hypothetical protein